jgi:hypothetical protein
MTGSQFTAFIAIMGGFRLLESDYQKRTTILDLKDNPECFRDVLLRYQFLLPSAEGIEDKSKADVFVKGFAVLQNSWLVGRALRGPATDFPFPNWN